MKLHTLKRFQREQNATTDQLSNTNCHEHITLVLSLAPCNKVHANPLRTTLDSAVLFLSWLKTQAVWGL